MVIVSYTLTDISDSNGYLQALGVKQTSEVKKTARIGSAIAKAEAVQVASQCSNVTQQKVFECETVCYIKTKSKTSNKICYITANKTAYKASLRSYIQTYIHIYTRTYIHT